MLFAGLLLEGGIVGYDANTFQGGVGARYLGIGTPKQSTELTLSTVVMRLVSVSTGRVLMSVATPKTIASPRSRVIYLSSWIWELDW